jgi:hypothetical protein
MTSVPREVNGKWYPVPCPEFLSIGQSFPSYDACLAACETAEMADEALEQFELTFGTTNANEIVQNHEAEVEATDEQACERGFDNHRFDGCGDTDCACFERGVEHADAQSKAKPA